MNTKKQTVWLVSMLSLMVVLSAYYLFSDRGAEDPLTTAENSLLMAETDEVIIDSKELTLEEAMTEFEMKTDEQIIEKLAARETMSHDFFTAHQLGRLEKISAEADRLMQVINDAASSSVAITEAYEKLSQLEEKQSRILHVEEQLRREFENVVISEEEGNWSVVVLANDLGKGEVVSIMDLVTNELNISPPQVQVQLRR